MTSPWSSLDLANREGVQVLEDSAFTMIFLSFYR